MHSGFWLRLLPRSRPLARSRIVGYIPGMKIAFSIPDEVFRKVEQHARRTKNSRSELYRDAISEYLSRHAPDAVTEAMNKVLAGMDAPMDPFVAGAGCRILK